jgi:hypothetical protein
MTMTVKRRDQGFGLYREGNHLTGPLWALGQAAYLGVGVLGHMDEVVQKPGHASFLGDRDGLR